MPFDERCAAGNPADFLQFRQSHGLFVDFGITPATTGLLAPRGGRTMKSGKTLISLLTITHAFLCLHESPGRRYEVGPTKPLTAIGQVPRESLQARDTVLIYWRSTQAGSIPRGNLISPGAHFAD